MPYLYGFWGILLTVFVTLNAASYRPAYAGDLKVTVTGITQPQGYVRIAVFNSDKGWPSEGPRVAGVFVQASPDPKKVRNKVSVIFPDMPKGRYAFSAYHDVNGSNTLDTNFFGVPKESYGFSNGASKFKQALVRVGNAPKTNVLIQLMD